MAAKLSKRDTLGVSLKYKVWGITDPWVSAATLGYVNLGAALIHLGQAIAIGVLGSNLAVSKTPNVYRLPYGDSLIMRTAENGT